MKIHLLKRKELEERVNNTPNMDMHGSSMFYTPNHQAITLQKGFNNIVGHENLKEVIKQLEQETHIPADYLTVDVVGAITYLQTTTHQKVEDRADANIGRFVTRLRSSEVEPGIDTDMQDEIRNAIINTKALKHHLTYGMGGAKDPAAQLEDGLLITDATAENYDNLTTFLDDYFAEVTSQSFHTDVQQAYTRLEETKNEILEGFYRGHNA